MVSGVLKDKQAAAGLQKAGEHSYSTASSLRNTRAAITLKIHPRALAAYVACGARLALTGSVSKGMGLGVGRGLEGKTSRQPG